MFVFISSTIAVPINALNVVSGHTARMECDLQSDRPEDRAYLVLWYIETQKQPIYRYVAYISIKLHVSEIQQCPWLPVDSFYETNISYGRLLTE